MICSNCSTLNPDTGKFCVKCGQPIVSPNPPVSLVPAPPPIRIEREKVLQVAKSVTAGLGAIVGSLVGILGGAAIIIGWLLPWVSLGGVLSSTLGLGGLFGLTSPLMDTIGGLGNGLQISWSLISLGFLMLNNSQSASLGLLALILSLVVIVLPLIGIGILRSGIKMLEMRTESGHHANAEIGKRLKEMRGQASTVFVILAIIFVGFAALPFGVAVLGTGFMTMLAASVVVFFGALFTRSMLGQ